jgi:hypothetical protein
VRPAPSDSSRQLCQARRAPTDEEWHETFGPGQDRSCTEQEHQLYLATLRQRTWQRKQAAGQRNHLEFSGNTTPAIKPKDDGSIVFQVNARSSWNRVTMGEGAHIQARSMALGNHEKKVTEGLVRVDFPDMFAKKRRDLTLWSRKDGGMALKL